VLESRAILEIVKGRLSIINKFERMIVDNKPETASGKTHDNMHDLLAEYPWIFNPQWQLFAEEKSVGSQLREWGIKDCEEDMKLKRVDFLAFGNDSELVIIELKRSGWPITWPEIERLQKYQVALMAAHPNTRMVVVYGGSHSIPQRKWEDLQSQSDLQFIEWSELFSRAKAFYSHYESILEGDVSHAGFGRKQIEVSRTRAILETDSSHRGKQDRQRGLGNADP
jgi:hypothetical protein